jgi:hypothetical protein
MAERDWRELSRGEAKHLDYKSPMSWDEAKTKLLKHIIAMSNNRDGGMLVIGVAENTSTGAHEPATLSEEQLATYDTTSVAEYVNAYVQPGVSLEVQREKFDGANVIIIKVAEFERTPNICVRDGPGDDKNKNRPIFIAGDVLIRTEAAASRRVQSADEMKQLLDLARAKDTENLLRSFRRLLEGEQAIDVSREREERAREAIEEMQKNVGERVAKKKRFTVGGFFSLRVLPSAPVALDGDAFDAVRASTIHHRDSWTFPCSPYDTKIIRKGFTQGDEDVPGYEHEWRYYDDGTFLYVGVLIGDDEIDKYRNSTGTFLFFYRAVAAVALAFMFATRFYTARRFDGSLHVGFRWTHTRGRKLVHLDPYGFETPENYACREEFIDEHVDVTMLDMQSGWERIATRILKSVFALFQDANAEPAITRQLRDFVK